ncbi:GNAT family N-acetyltransferase [Thalassospira sp.]|jgi:N-acetylglutamate synthase-like GNAT family acetyltransferase|uniref:GNAT family N-acetyltransferase n=1 Tax=Thalassospira sp. TaxID=1912094 RepID=UPI0025ED2B62|nr:GNAT family N-acetyltransferase [Thalassospira sp.]|tara:strand:+ start:16376 stop:16831 length:456 start_codon:yes stop_codon:yes gene_type:complete
MEKDKYKIRKAQISDAVRIRELLKTWLIEAPFNFGNTNNKKALENIVFYIKNSFVIVVEYENIIVGTLAATVDETWYSDKKFMRTLWLHVSPQHRRFSIFRSLMIVFKEYALANKVTAICEIFQGKDVERKNNAFIKLGFKVIGGTFIVNG